MGEYKKLEDLEIYIIARQVSRLAWTVYIDLSVDQKIMMGQQFVRSVDSICANIAEGYGRYYFLEKIRFYYIARASLLESITWVELLKERDLITNKVFSEINNNLKNLHLKLNSYIKYNVDIKNSRPSKK